MGIALQGEANIGIEIMYTTITLHILAAILYIMMKAKDRSKATPIYHVSIAVVRRIANSSALGKEPPKYDYLVLKDAEGEHYFLDMLDRAINGRFDLSAMTKRVVEHFGLQNHSEFTAREPFLQSRSGAGATAYSFLLATDQEQVIDGLFKSRVLVDSAVWVGEADLHRHRATWRKRQSFLFERATDSFSHPTFPAQLRLNITNIVKAKNHGKLVVFAGAGVSIDSGVPGWASLLDQLRAEMEEQDSAEDPLITAQRYQARRRNKEYQERVQEVLNHPQTTFNPLHEVILELRPQHVITTNFDQHFEQAVKESSARYSIVKKDSDLPYAKEAALIVKMHGDFGERNIVLTKKDYIRYGKDFPLIESFVKSVFSSSLVLFVGFSFNDPNLKQILRTVKSILGADHQQPYLLVSGGSKGSKHLENDLHVVTIEPGPVDKYFEEAQLPNDARQLRRLSKTGQQVFKFLRLVDRWDLASDAMANTGLGEQLRLSLGRFKEFGAIPMSTIEKLVPLRLNKGIAALTKSNDADHSRHEPFLLRSKNDALFRYFREISQGGVVKFRSSSVTEGAEVDQALRLLYSSSVHTIGRASDAHPEVFRLEPDREDVVCTCMGCRYRRLEFADLLSDIESLATKSICSRERSDLGLKAAWALFKMGQPVRSYYALEEVRIRSQQTHQHVSYYLACLNIKNLRPFLYSSRHIKQEELDQIISSIDDLDVDRVLAELPVDREVRETLRSFRASKPLDATRWFIHEQMEKISEIHEKYSRGGFRTSGPVHWFEVEAAMYSLYNLLRMNFLIEDEYGAFQRVVQSYLDCMLTSYATPADYKARSSALSEFFVMMLVEYGDAEWVADRIDSLGLKRLELEDGVRDKVLDRFKNFLHSGFERQKFFGNDALKRPLFEQACESHLFASRVRRTFDSHLLLFSLLEWRKDEAREMLGLVLDFLSVSDCFGGARSHKPFLHFVDALAGTIDPVDFERLLRYAIADHIWSSDLLPGLCESIRSVDYRFKAKAGLYERVLARTKRKDWHSKLEQMIPLHQFLVAEEQARMTSDLKLGESAYSEQTELLWRSYFYGLWNPTDNPDLWRNYCARLSTEVGLLQDHYIPDDGFPKDIKDFGPWNGIRHCIRMAYEHNKRATPECQLVVDHLTNRMFTWALRPEDFDYGEFNYRWILSFEDWYMDRIPWSAAMIASVEVQLEKEFVPGVARALYRHRSLQKQLGHPAQSA